MKNWAGAGIATVTLIIALWVNPAKIIGFETLAVKVTFAGILLALSGLAFFLGYRMSGVNISRQITIWSAGLAVIAIFATNMDIVTGTSVVVKPVAKVKKPYVSRVKKTKSSAIYVPDTLKINRVERLVAPEQNAVNPFGETNDRDLVPNLFTKQDTPLANDWQPSQAQKKQFKRFLQSRGLKYDPATAFKRPGAEETPSKPLSTNPKAAKGDAFTSFN